MSQVIGRIIGHLRPVMLFLLSSIILGEIPANAQLFTGYRPVEEPGIYGARVRPGALAPNRRKWHLPQNLYYEYSWRGWEYSNYARQNYQRYVNILLEGTRQYDPFGNYIARGWKIYDWTENSPERLGSGVFKNQFYQSWFSNVVVSSAKKGQFHTSLTIGDAIRTTLTPLTFSKPTFNGLQWDFLSDKYAVTLLASRLSSPAFAALTQTSQPSRSENTSRLLGGRGIGQLGDFAQIGLTWVNVANTTSTLTLGDNSLKGVLTEPQNQGSVETVVVRISDDSPETPQSGALLFFDQVVINGKPHPEITPLIRGGIRSEGNLEARGTDVIELIYDVRNDFRPTEEVPTLGDISKLEFELIITNDYRVEVSSNKQTDRLGGQVFLPVAQAEKEVIDGSNQRFIRFEYGLPTAHEVIGLDLEINNLGGLDLRAEYAVNRRFRRFPNQNFGVNDLDPEKDRAEAAYVTASYNNYPWFAYTEAFDMNPDYSTTAFISNSLGGIDYSDEQRHLFEFVDDNDDQDRFPDWQRINQIGLVGDVGGAGADNNVFPGLDENNDFVSDFNQNANSRPDYAEPFLRYAVDPPEFLFGMDMNNNTLIDRFEDDRQPDFPYERDRRGYNIYGGLMLAKRAQITIGRLKERMPSSSRKSRATYGLLTAEVNMPGWNIGLVEHAKLVKDNIKDDRLVWKDPTGSENFSDPLENQDTFVNTLYLQARYNRIRDLDIQGKIKYEIFNQRGDQADELRNRSFLGLINKAGYAISVGENLTLRPKWKSTFRREIPSTKTSLKSRDLEETLFLITRYLLLPGTWVEGGVEFSWFENLEERPEEPPPSFIDDFSSQVVSILMSNTSVYLGYELTANVGLQLRRTKFKEEDTRDESIGFVRIFASTGTD